MPKLGKNWLSRNIRTQCDRQLRLGIATNDERAAEGMPAEQPPRPGLEDAAEEGIKWQHEKVSDLIATFGPAAVIAAPKQGSSGVSYRPIDLAGSLTKAAAAVPAQQPSVWLVEPEYPMSTATEQALGITAQRQSLGISYSELRPDLVEVRPAAIGTTETEIRPGGETAPLPAADTRLRLRVIDIKLTAEPSAGYFAEVVLYSMTLAGWLADHGRDQEFVVIADAALWPGSHDASQLKTFVDEAKADGRVPTADEMRAALVEDLEPVPFEVFAPAVRSFFQETVPRVLAIPWDQTEFHVDNRCRSCPFLGGPWQIGGKPTAEPGHCLPKAGTEDHLSKVAYVTRGARTALERGGISKVGALASTTPSDAALDGHHVLRGSRTVVHERAAVLTGLKSAALAPISGTSAVMPRWADLRLHISVDFDASSAITFAFAVEGFWIEPRPYGAAPAGPQRATHSHPARVFVVDQRSIATERREFLAFLSHLEQIFSDALQRDANSTFQVYIWDQLQLKHLARVIGRHLPAVIADQKIRDLAWLFPSDEVVPNPNSLNQRSPITIIREVVRAMVAAPVDHYYALLPLAREYHHAGLPATVASFSVHPLFEDPLSDQIPSERAHEIWSRSSHSTRNWNAQLPILEETVRKRLRAAEGVRRRLEEDLKGELKTVAPRIRTGAMMPVAGVADVSQLWIAYAKIDAALNQLDVAQLRAMPPHERESKFRSARLEKRLAGSERASAAAALPGVRPSDLIYRMREESREVKLRERDFSVALAPESQPGILDQTLKRLTDNTALDGVSAANPRLRMEQVLGVTVLALDRDQRLIVLRPDSFWSQSIGAADLLNDLERHKLLDLGTDCILDPVHANFFTRKLESTLKEIKNPPSAVVASSAKLKDALGDYRPRGSRKTKAVPAGDLLWDGPTMYAANVSRDIAHAKQRLRAHGLELNDSQWDAWRAALSRRLQPIWGPPGTGKSKTLRAVVLGAAVEAHDSAKPLRILIGASNYTALDNVLGDVADELPNLLGAGADLEIFRLRSPFKDARTSARDTEISGSGPVGTEATDLMRLLRAPTGVVLAGATPEQLHNLLSAGTGSPMFEAFDLLVLDEASQTDVAHATLFAAAMAEGASVVPAGDTRQLPPITLAQPLQELENLVGSFLRYLEEAFAIPSKTLDVNYRSNEDIVSLAHVAGYRSSLKPASPDLRLDLDPPPARQPADWPTSVEYDDGWQKLLDPDQPVAAYVYDDHAWSSQWNDFEAQAVASLVAALAPRMQADLLNELDAGGAPLQTGPRTPMSSDELLRRGVGVVTPHRAQQALIVRELSRAFPAVGPALLRSAVDTVERFQGQQRDVIIVSYALGDVDAIADEDEFLMNMNRFNVASSRARAKLIVLVSQQVVSHLSKEVEVLHDSRLLKLFATDFCSAGVDLDLPYRDVKAGRKLVRGRRLWHP